MPRQTKKREAVSAVPGTEIVPSRPAPKRSSKRTGQPEAEFVSVELIPSPAMLADTNV
jgi:hypothetical protein